MTTSVIFHVSKDTTTMTNTYDFYIACIIEELRAELRNAHPAERRQIEAELELALAEREVIRAEQEGRIRAEPPF